MKAIYTQALIAVFVVLTIGSDLAASPPAGPAYVPVLVDDFSAGVTSLWKYREGARIDSYDQMANVTALTYQADAPAADGLSVGKNCLDIAGKQEPVNDYNFTGGGLISTGQYGYGYYEVCAKLPQVVGWHSSFWIYQDSNPIVNEIDGFEINYDDVNGTPGVDRFTGTFGTFIYTNFAGNTNRRSAISRVTYGLEQGSATTVKARGPFTIPTANLPTDSNFHNFGFEWTPSAVSYYIDGVLVRQTAYAGPATPNNIWITCLADNIGDGIQDNAHLLVSYIKYWSRPYGGPVPTANIVPMTTANLSASWGTQLSGLTELGLTSYAMGNIYTTVAANSTANWSVPSGASGGCEVYVYNPSLFAPNILSPDNPLDDHPYDGTTDDRHLVQYKITHDTGNLLSMAVDQVFGGQQWIPLGAYSFTAGSGEGVQLTVPNTPLIATRAGPVAFRALNLVYDNFDSGILSGWTPASGPYAIAGTVLNESAATEQLLLRSATSWQNYLVRVTLQPGSATSLGVIGYYQDATDYYLLRIDTIHGKLGVLRRSSSGWQTLDDEVIPSDLGYSPTAWSNVILVLSGDATNGVTLRGFLNGREIVQYLDKASPLTSGTVGLRTYGGTAQYDQFGAGY